MEALADRAEARERLQHRLQPTSQQLPQDNVPPDVVLGQPNFSTNDSGHGPNQLLWPTDVAAGGGKYIVADSYNNRILIWNSVPNHISPNTIITVSYSGPTFVSIVETIEIFILGRAPMTSDLCGPNCIGHHACLGCSWTSFEL